MIRGALSHVDLTVTELSRSQVFYDHVLRELGYKPLPEAGAGSPCWGIADTAGGFFTIALQTASREGSKQKHDRYAPGLHHMAFHADSREDVDDFYKFLLTIGVQVLDPPAEYTYTEGYYALFFADPDGLKFEVVFEPTLRGNV
ncbi:MAG: VOC family protein [Chloroflexota bacterium]